MERWAEYVSDLLNINGNANRLEWSKRRRDEITEAIRIIKARKSYVLEEITPDDIKFWRNW